jgi:hypothetical protein
MKVAFRQQKVSHFTQYISQKEYFKKARALFNLRFFIPRAMKNAVQKDNWKTIYD